MTTLVADLLALLRGHRLIQTLRVIEHDETPWGKIELKMRCQVSLGSEVGQRYQFQVWLHVEPTFLDYAYQLYTDRPLLRWDNAPHYPGIATAPHHSHDEVGTVATSPLSGNPLVDLPSVLREIEQWIARR